MMSSIYMRLTPLIIASTATVAIKAAKTDQKVESQKPEQFGQ